MMPWFKTREDEERKRKTDEALERSRVTSKKACDSRDRVVKSLQEIEELIRNARVQRGPDSECG